MRWLVLLMCTLLLSLPAAAQTSSLEAALVVEVNLLRTHPRDYAGILRNERQNYEGRIWKRPDGRRLATAEGVATLDEAIDFLSRQPPVGELTVSTGLCMGARDHVLDQGRTGATDHPGSDGSTPFDRVNRYGRGNGVGENLAYGTSTARDIVIQLVVDDNVPDRGHRTNFFRPQFRKIGVAVGPHPVFRTMCTIDMAMSYSEDEAAQAAHPSQQSLARAVSDRPAPALTLPAEGTSFADARSLADALYAAASAQDREGWRSLLTATNRYQTARLWPDARAASGERYTYACVEKMKTGRIQFRYLRHDGAKITPCFLTVIEESGHWAVDEATY